MRLGILLTTLLALSSVAAAATTGGGAAVSPAIVTTYATPRPRGVMATSGGWAYCHQLRQLARRTGYTLVCGRYAKDGYTAYGLRARRHLDWGDRPYLAALAARVRAEHARVGGRLVLLGVSYSGYGVAALAAQHPELRPDALVVIDSYFDLVQRRRAAKGEIAQEIDEETGGAAAELADRSVTPAQLAHLVRTGTELTVVWTVSAHEAALFHGATCDRNASAGTLSRLANVVRRPVDGWVTRARHGVNLWRHGPAIVAGRPPGRRVVFRPLGGVPAAAVCKAP